MNDSFLTIAATSESSIREKGSKFFGYAYPVRTENEVKDQLAALRKTYFDATHHCYAYILGKDKSIFRANDDGEPSNSAGTPILGQIRSRNLTNVLVVVVRYFGGTKLGVGGLVQAYKESAAQALDAAQVVEELVMTTVQFRFGYEQLSLAMRIVKDLEMTILEQDFQETCILNASMREGSLPTMYNKLEGVMGITVNVL